MLKPLFVSEQEAIEDAVTSTKFALENGSRRIVLMVNSVKPYNVQHELYRVGMYRAPWLWSVKEALNRMSQEGINTDIVNVYGFKSGVEIIQAAHNCGKCDQGFLDALDHFNYTNDLSKLNEISCLCEDEWKKELEQGKSLIERIREGHIYLGNHIIGKDFDETLLDERLRL